MSLWLKKPDLSKGFIVALCLIKLDLSPKCLNILWSAILVVFWFSPSFDNLIFIWLVKSDKSILFIAFKPWEAFDSFIFLRPFESNNLLTSVVDKINFFWFISGWIDINFNLLILISNLILIKF